MVGPWWGAIEKEEEAIAMASEGILRRGLCGGVLLLAAVFFWGGAAVAGGLTAPAGPAAATAASAEAASASPAAGASCVVRAGDTLRTVAARKEVYGERMAWPLLFRRNIVLLRSLKLPAGEISTSPLPEGLRLFVTSSEAARAAASQKAAASSRWFCVNVESVRNENDADLTRKAEKLLLAGYFVYLARHSDTRGRFVRLRVGFFADRVSALAARDAIRGLLKDQAVWIDSPAPGEIGEFIGYKGD